MYKFPIDNDSPAICLKNSRVIDAYTAKAGVYFYENDSGQILWTQSKLINKDYILINPQVTLFDKNMFPILFVEIGPTHKLKTDRFLKLLQLGIDTVSVRIPSSSPQEIAEVFKHTKNTKWLYNYEEASTEYIPVPNRDTEGVRDLDEEQKKLFGESLRCRKAHLNNVIYRVRRCLESQPYRNTESRFESEISRVEKNTEELQDRLFNEEAELREKLSTKFDGETRAFDDQINEIDLQYANLEGRYLRKTEELEENRKRLIGSIRNLQFKIESISGRPEEREIDHRREIDNIERKIGDIELGIDGVIADREASKSRYDEHIRQEEETIRRDKEYREGVPESSRRKINDMVEKYRQEEIGIVENIKRSESTRDSFGERSKREGDKLREEFEILDQSSIRAIENADFGENPYLSEQYEAMLSAERLLLDYVRQQKPFSRSAKVKKFIESSEFKNWI